MGFMMKRESGFRKIGESMVAEGYKLDAQVGGSMTPKDNLGKSILAHGGIKKAGPAKGKVIPLRQEDIKSLDGSGTRKRVMVGLVIIMSVVLALILVRPTGLLSGGEKNPQKTGVIAPSEVKKDTPASVIWKVPGAIGKGVRDITGSFGKKSELPKPPELPQLVVSGIVVYNNKKMSAIIGDEIVKVGDVVKGVKIYSITFDSVVFEMDGVRWAKKVGQL
jgi:hypothetical protein